MTLTRCSIDILLTQRRQAHQALPSPSVPHVRCGGQALLEDVSPSGYRARISHRNGFRLAAAAGTGCVIVAC
jgi:hypothetical protein